MAKSSGGGGRTGGRQGARTGAARAAGGGARRGGGGGGAAGGEPVLRNARGQRVTGAREEFYNNYLDANAAGRRRMLTTTQGRRFGRPTPAQLRTIRAQRAAGAAAVRAEAPRRARRQPRRA